ncbi:MAG: leucine-rich repeat protein [Alistipes sp.]|nr:leucine-rich repeat protein [Alistipes sp.]
MKTKLLFGLGCVAMLFASCTKDPDEVIVSIPKQMPIQLSGSIDQVVKSRVNDDGFCNGDGFGLFAVNYENGVPGTLLEYGNQANNVRYVFNEKEYKWTPDYPVYYRDNITPVDMIGYYPYNGALENVNNYSFEVQQDQSTTVESTLMGGYEASDFLWGKVENVQPTAERINIKFNHAMAGVQVELKEGNGWADGEWASVEKHALIANTIRKASIDLATGAVTAVGERDITDIVPAINGEYYRAIVVPQIIDASMALMRITVDGTPYLFRKSEALEYEAGKLHKFTISVSKKELTGVEFELVGEEITPWESETISHDGKAREYIVINVPEASNDSSGALKVAIECAGFESARISNLKITGRLNERDFVFMRENMAVLSYVNIEDVVLCADYSNDTNNKLPWSAFNGLTNLQSVILPTTVEEIGHNAFCGTRIRSMYFPNSVKKLGQNLFAVTGEHPIERVNIPTSLEEIGDCAFQKIDKIENFHLPHTLKKIGASAFDRAGLNCELHIPESVEEIGDNAFYGCGLIGGLRIPNSITHISDYAFAANPFGGNLILPQSLLTIGTSAFHNAEFTGELIIPDGVVSIGASAFCLDKFSGELRLPKTVNYIGRDAFNGVGFTGTLEIPIDVQYVDASAFTYTNISSIVIHSGVREISGTAYLNHIESVVCKGKNPPAMSTHSFINNAWGGSNEQAIRSINIQVPEEALYKYQTAQYWGDYIPSVYRDFKLDLERTYALNAQFSRKMIVRAPADMEWSVTHKPDWVTVTPSSGLGKIEVTITCDEMARGNGNRADSLVFTPTAYDYYKVVKVEQCDYQYNNGDVITNQMATKGNGVNIVFMGDCFDAKDIAEGYYEEIMNEAIEHFFAVEPYKTYRDYFNVYTVVGHSADSGLPTTYTINKETLFESRYSYDPMLGFDFKINQNKCFEYACFAPTVTKNNLCQTPVVVIENSNVYGGITYMWGDNSSLAVQSIMRNSYPFDFRGVIQHEVGGHAFGKLLDEYIYHGTFIDSCNCFDGCPHDDKFLAQQALGWGKNLSLNASHYDVPWSHLIFDPQYSSYVEMYEGGYMHQRGVYRSEQNSCMNNNVPYYSAISRQAIVERIMEYAGEEFTFEKFKAKDSAEIGPVPMSMTRGVATEAESYNPLHNEPVIVGEKPELNF